MGKKLTIGFVREQFEKEGYTLLSEKYINNKVPLEYICPKGHIWSITWNNWSQGKRCRPCSGSQKLTIEFVREQFEKESYILLSEEYVGACDPLKYICPKGDYGMISWSNWQRGHRCSKCSGNKRLTIEFVRDQFKKEGYTLLSKGYINAKQELEYICPKGHTYSISWDCWKQGNRCLECGGSKRLTIEFVREQFEKEGYTLLTKEYVNSHTRLNYICPKGHYWYILWNNWQQGARCKRCQVENNTKENHPRWDTTITDEERKIKRNYLEYTEWRCKVKERDDFICKNCGKRGGNLVSHHLDSYSNTPNLRTALDNGVCLCEKCHKNFHHQYGYGNNTRKQFEEFLLRRIKCE